jgi:calcineurin-like phosphoesterase family protein
MTGEIWFASDHHFDHTNILTFTERGTDNLIRPGFRDIDEMNEHIIDKHNKFVGVNDKVYFGGDLGKNIHKFIPRMNGKKRLILGNHDDLGIEKYIPHFQKILSWREFGDRSSYFMFCHYPLHRSAFDYRGSRDDMKFCVHGHLHEKFVMHENGEIDLRYINVSMEQTNYCPVSMTQLLGWMHFRKRLIEKGL